MSNVVMCSIDSSTANTGIAKFVNGNYTNSFVLSSSKIKDPYKKHEFMFSSIYLSLSNLKPDIVVVEATHASKNISSLNKLCKILGCIETWCILNGSEYHEMPPKEWRKYAGINGNEPPKQGRKELKDWSMNLVKDIFGVNSATDDESDAILIGYAYINMFNDKYVR